MILEHLDLVNKSDIDDSEGEESENNDNNDIEENYGNLESDEGSEENDSELHELMVQECLNRDYVDPDTKSCWVCFASQDEDRQAQWVKPCMCRGTSKWVHQACLNRWIDEKQKSNSRIQVSCPQCNTKYIIVYPYRGVLMTLFDRLDEAVYKLSPFATAGVLLGSLYWCAVTYGAVTVMVVVGRERGLQVMKDIDAIVLLVGLPAIPVVLILGSMIRWEDAVLKFLRRYIFTLPIMKYILPSMTLTSDMSSGDSLQQSLPPLTSAISATRVFCSALFLPSIATICGRYMFPSVQSNLQRTIIGGLAFLGIKGILSIYHKQQKYIMHKKRRVLDYVGPPRNLQGRK